MSESIKYKRPQSIKKKQFLQDRVKWHESTVVKSAAFAAFVILCGYLASMSIALQSFQTVSQIAYDPEVEILLNRHLESIKQIHKLRQEVFSLRLLRIIPAKEEYPNQQTVTEESVKSWLELAHMNGVFSHGHANIRILTESEISQNQNEPLVHWISRSKLKIYNHLVEFDQGKLAKNFYDAENLMHRYQLIGASWEKKIRPTFIQANMMIMLVTISLFTGSLFFITYRLRKKIGDFILGFNTWSERDSNFRFDNRWQGELRTIAHQFNRMADEVATNRKRTLYLEKISSWQIIARKLAHEIKNPLTPIQMMISQVVRRYKGADEDFQQLLQKCQTIIVEEVNRLRHMVDNFSEFAQLPSPRFASVNLSEVCQQVVTMEQATYPHHRIRFNTQEQEFHVPADKNLIKQTLLNLVKNAAEACDQPAQIEISIHHVRNFVEITVSDTGPGVPQDMQNRIFEAYFTTKDTGPSPGMGLGLAICQKIIIEHNGDLLLRSEPGKTDFTIKIPKTRKGIA